MTYIYIYIREHLGWVFVRGPFGLPSTRYVRMYIYKKRRRRKKKYFFMYVRM
jgi:hypothetical protein